MKDDISPPNLGMVPREYDQRYFLNLVRMIEVFTTALRSKGPVTVSSIEADEVNTVASNVTTVNATTVNATTVNADNVNVTGTMTGNVDAGTVTSDSVDTDYLNVLLYGTMYGGYAIDVGELEWGLTTLKTDDSQRWAYGKNADTESGSNEGGNFVVYRYADDGSFLSEAMRISRRYGTTNFETMPSVNWTDLIEYGSNANGEYVKFADGQMIAWINTTRTDISITNAYGSLYQGVHSWTFPVAFVGTPAVTCNTCKWGTSASWGHGYQAATTTTGYFRAWDINSRAAGTSTTVSLTAVGRWK